jgi:hypothetical protein
MGGGSVNITIPAIHIIGYNGLKDWFHTNGPLTATIQADTHLKLGEADYGKGMSHIDFPVIVPMPGLYPLHLVYVEGGCGCVIEFCVVTPSGAAFDGTRVLMNDNSNPNSLLSYRALTTPARFVSESVVNGILNLTWVGAGALQSATTLSPPNWADVNPPPYGDTYSGPATGPAKFFRIHAISGVMDPSGGTGH